MSDLLPQSRPQSAPSSLPLHVQVSELLIRDIMAGRLVDGERLPPERALAKRLGIAVGTLRKALQIMADKGHLRRIQGSGNYVEAGAHDASLYAMFRLELPEGGGLPIAQILDVSATRKPEDAPAFGQGPEATRIRRLRSLNDTIIAVEEIFICAADGPLEKSRISESLYQTYREVYGYWIRRAEDQVRVGPVPDWAPDAFAPPPGTIVGFIERRAWAEDRNPIEYSRTWFDPDRARYVQRLK